MKAAIARSVRTTKYSKREENPEKWYVVDAEGKTLGRMASEIAKRIRGKMNPRFTPNMDTGDWVVVVNAEKVKISVKREEQKEYLRHTLYPGGQKSVSYKEMLQKHPDRIIRLAVKRMLPKTRLGNKLINKLKVYRGPEHPHKAQKPAALEL
jgi:large subunit ribosomal protein L13